MSIKQDVKLQAHQQRVVDKLNAQRALLVYHGLGSGKSLASIAATEGRPTLEKVAGFSKKTLIQAAINRLKRVSQAESPFFHQKLKDMMAKHHREALGKTVNLAHGKQRTPVAYAKHKFVENLQEALPNPKSLGFQPPPADKYIRHPETYSLATAYDGMPSIPKRWAEQYATK